MLARVSDQLDEKRITMEISDRAKNLLAKRGFDPVLGARPLRRTIQREIEDQLSEKILYGEVGLGETVFIDVEGWDGESKDVDKAKFTFTNKGKAGNVDADGGALGESEEDKDVLGSADGTLSVEADDIEGAADQAAAEVESDNSEGEN